MVGAMDWSSVGTGVLDSPGETHSMMTQLCLSTPGSLDAWYDDGNTISRLLSRQPLRSAVVAVLLLCMGLCH
jgi:hypothetical protein